MNILILGWEYPPFNSGGLGVACHWLAKYLSKKHNIIFVLPKRVKINFPFGKMIFAEDYLNAKFPDSIMNPYATDLASWNSQSLHSQVILYSKALEGICRKFNFDIIHAHDWLTYPAGIAAKNISKKPLIVHIHATEFDRSGGGSGNPAVYHIEKKGFDSADKIIAVSHFTKDKVERHYNIAPDTIAVVHNGIETFSGKITTEDVISKVFGKKIVVFVGRLTLQKGPDYFLKAAKKTLEHYKDVMFVLAGAGEMQHFLIEEAARQGIADKVIFSGFLRNEDLDKLYQNADLFVMPSVSEPFGITALEAMANGAPILISKQSGVNEVVKHALKVDFWDINEMTNKILAVLNYEPLKKTLRENGYKECSAITWQDAAEKIHNIYLQFAPVCAY